jgi:hypothetical protein
MIPKFPLDADELGEATKSVQVAGSNGTIKTYSIHQTLLCKASRYFDRLFHSGFKESGSNTIYLEGHYADVFKAFFDFIYTGRLLYPFYYTKIPDEMPEDHFWFRLVKLAHFLMVPELLEKAFWNFRQDLSQWSQKAPTDALLKELYDDECPLKQVQEYLVAYHCRVFHNLGLTVK